MKRIIRALLATSAAAAVLSACAETGTSDPSPATSGAPPGGDALDISRYVDAPCGILKPDQVTALGTFREPEAGTSVSGPSCTYEGSDVLKDSTYEIIFVNDGSTYEEIVDNSKSDPTFSQSDVSGVPIMSSDAIDGLRSCTTAIRTSDKDAILVQADIAKNDAENNGQACEATEKLAATVIANLKG
ncbi:hypothetical protein JOF41_000253 [Saccharothrix coeruleofusca]|uniref:DUF3558 domain-containing protein n=1 Tax=Saccharothrix coeruleofusca TaxID=33919 RepID=UPI001AE77532|nr:DUF3558 domain-containing protein [Saccharothrix coeruleofusca]MBP2334075.1 hypothetical protein [Saccharothrix coeruleofusca]